MQMNNKLIYYCPSGVDITWLSFHEINMHNSISLFCTSKARGKVQSTHFLRNFTHNIYRHFI